jgi:hypothetical protein
MTRSGEFKILTVDSEWERMVYDYFRRHNETLSLTSPLGVTWLRPPPPWWARALAWALALRMIFQR